VPEIDICVDYYGWEYIENEIGMRNLLMIEVVFIVDL
jgi:hypothetical protein